MLSVYCYLFLSEFFFCSTFFYLSFFYTGIKNHIIHASFSPMHILYICLYYSFRFCGLHYKLLFSAWKIQETLYYTVNFIFVLFFWLNKFDSKKKCFLFTFPYVLTLFLGSHSFSCVFFEILFPF